MSRFNFPPRSKSQQQPAGSQAAGLVFSWLQTIEPACWCLPCGCCLTVRLANDMSELTSPASAASGYNTLALRPSLHTPVSAETDSFHHFLTCFCQRFARHTCSFCQFSPAVSHTFLIFPLLSIEQLKKPRCITLYIARKRTDSTTSPHPRSS